jgi:hypothetical protein
MQRFAFDFASLAKWVGRTVKFVSDNALYPRDSRGGEGCQLNSGTLLFLVADIGRLAHLAEGRRFGFSGVQFTGLRRECRRFQPTSAGLGEWPEWPLRLMRFLGVFLRGA